MLRIMILVVGMCFAFGGSAKADCYSDCAAEAGICAASWNAWAGVCHYASWDRWQAEDYNCSNNCSSPCDPDLCHAANNADWDAADASCNDTYNDGIDDCGIDLAQCLIGCAA